MYSATIVSVDGTPAAAAATQHGALLAHLLDAELCLIHVVRPEGEMRHAD
jgi:nucleotide-binding universal stress UspA family protein